MATRGWEHATPMDTRHRRAVEGSVNGRKPAKAGRSKYGAIPTTVDGIRFDSAKEAKRYGELKLLEKAQEIYGLVVQPSYPLEVVVAHARAEARRHVIGTYRGDFVYYTSDGNDPVVEDVKGFKTPLYRWKKKHFEAQYGIEIREI